MTRVLVTSAGSTAAQNLIAILDSKKDWWTLAADMAPRHCGLGMADVDTIVPAGRAAEFIPRLIELVRKHELDLVVPGLEADLLAASRHRQRIEKAGARVLVSSPETLEVCFSKRKLAMAIEGVGLATPTVLDPGTRLDFPVFVRPDAGTGSRRAGRVQDRDALQRRLAREPDLVVTEYCDGAEYSIDGFAWPPGELMHAIARTRDVIKSGLVVRSTVVALGRQREQVARLCTELDLVGFFNMQYRERADGTPLFFDVNPRLGGGMALSFAAGLDPLACLDLFLGKPVQPAFQEQLGLELCRRWHNVILRP
ncbi:MAG: ATP-grasp domain-containing protein [bacterium]|nr:ATP-grasp domain-containing protein [bacterium]